jgi:hypothetical protein
LGSQQFHPLAQGGVLSFQLGDTGGWCHANSLHLLRKSA